MNVLQIAAMNMQAMLTSKYVNDFMVDGRESDESNIYDALAAEAFKYAEALLKANEVKK